MNSNPLNLVGKLKEAECSFELMEIISKTVKIRLSNISILTKIEETGYES